MKLFLIFLSFCLCLNLNSIEVFSQGASGTGASSPISLDRVIPPSPEAGALSRFGNFPVGLYTGTPEVNIELFQLKPKKVEIPIGLNYSSNGLKVDDLPTKVGMSWILNAGGVISRTVYDKPDGVITNAGTPYTDVQLSSNNSTDLYVPAWLEEIDFYKKDTQFDEYNFNFNGYSGKFIIDLNNKPVLVPYSNLKIEINPFRITTPDGLQYYFEAEELNPYLSSGGCSRDNSQIYTTAWYLSKVINLNDPSDYITLSYIGGSYTFQPNINQTITFFDASNTCTGVAGDTDPCGCGPTPCIYGAKGSPNLAVDNFCTNTQSVTVQYISEITSSLYGKIKFLYNTSYPTSVTPIAIDRLLTDVQVYQNNDGTSLLNLFKFNYIFAKPSTSGKITSVDNISTENPDINSFRPFLSSIQELDNTNTVFKTYSFEYDDINNLTARLSSSQDFWGYFNGKSNPNSFIPSDGGIIQNSLLPKTKIADRNPDYNFAVKGMLTKVTFPTGGNTKFIYEGNKKNNEPPPPPSAHYSVIQTGNVQATNITHAGTFYVLTPVTIALKRDLFCCQNGNNTCAIANNSISWGQLNYTPFGGLAVTFVNYTFAEYNQRGECSFSRDETLTLQPGIYGLNISGFDQYALSLTVQTTSGSIYALDAYAANTASLATDGGGIRVKQQIIFDPVTQQSTTTNYQYSGMVIPYTPKYVNNIYYKHSLFLFSTNVSSPCLSPPGSVINTCNYIQFSSNSSINTSGRGGSPIYYTSVTESVGDNFILGGTEHTYTWFAEANLNILKGTIISNASAPSFGWKNGLETNRNVFKIVNNSRVYLKKIINTYTDDNRINNSYSQYITKRSGITETTTPSTECPASLVFIQRMSVFDVISYVTVQQWTYLSSTQETNYDVNGNNPIVNTTNYFYDNPLHANLTRVETLDSKGLLIKTIKKYPGDAAIITNLTTSETDAITKLSAQNNLTAVLEREQYVNNNLQTRIHTGYKDWGNGIIKPETIKAQVQANTIEPRLQFTKYDFYGNILQQQKINDVNEVYLWGYKSIFPVAKIIGSDYNTVKQYVTSTILDNPIDDDALRTELNRIRVNLPSIQVITYTYSPLVGITSETDPRGKTIYYEYDTFSRLKLVRDKDNNIVKKFDYQYNQ